MRFFIPDCCRTEWILKWNDSENDSPAVFCPNIACDWNQSTRQHLHVALAELSISPCLHPDSPQIHLLLVLAYSIIISSFLFNDLWEAHLKDDTCDTLFQECKYILSTLKEGRITKAIWTGNLKYVWYKVPLM